MITNPIFFNLFTSLSLCTMSPRQYNLSSSLRMSSAISIANSTPKQNPEFESIFTFKFSIDKANLIRVSIYIKFDLIFFINSNIYKK